MPAIYHTKVVDDTFEGAKWHAKPATVVDDTVWHCNAADANFQGAIFHIKWVDNSYDGPVIRVTGTSPGGQTVVVGPAVSPLSLPDAVANSLQYVKAFGGTEQHNLPIGYTALEYIESSGTQYIDTNLLLSNTNEFEITFQSADATLNTPIMGAISGGTSFTSTNNLCVTYTVASGLNAYSVYCNGAAGDANESWNAGDAQDKLKHTVKYNGLNIAPTLDGVDMEQLVPTTLTTNTPTVTTWLFGRNNTGSGTKAQAGVRIYDFKVVGIAHFVPCKNASNVVGMYDLVSGQFFTNAGTGDFVAGPDIVPTPTAPMDIVCNNGVLKFTANEANYTADNVTLGYWIKNNTGQPEQSPANFYTAMMPVKPDVSYVCFGRNKKTNVISGYNRIAWYDADGVWIRNSTYTQNQPGIDVAPSNAAFARFHCNINGVEVTQELVDSYNWVFQQGTAEVPYTPYSPTKVYADGTVETIEDTIGNTATAEILLKVDNYQDVQSILDGVVTRKVGIKVLDGTENWRNISGYYNIAKTDLGTDSTVLPAATTDIICTHYETVSGVPDRTSVNVGGSYVNFRDDNISTLAGWKQWLADQYAAGTPVIIVYPLATPTTESVTGQTLQVTDGDNVLEITQASLTGLELEAEYEETV